MSDYWEDSISEALIEQGITATPEQIRALGKTLETSHDNYGMFRGHDCIPNPLESEVRKVEKLRESDAADHGKRMEEKLAFIEELKREIRYLRFELHEAKQSQNR